MKKLIFLYMFAAMACLTACSDDDEKSPEVKLEDTTLTFDALGGTETVNIGSDKGWWIAGISTDENSGKNTVTPTADEMAAMASGGAYEATYQWLSVKRNGGNIEITINDMNHGDRTFRITLATAKATAVITGTQEALLTGNMGDNIKLKPREVTFTAEGGTKMCTTDKDSKWTINNIRTDDESFVLSLAEREKCRDERKFEKTCGWLTVKRDGDNLYVTVEPNGTGQERKFSVTLTAGDTGNYLSGTQNAK